MARYKRKKSEGKIAHKKTIIDGITFDSKMESDFYVYLKAEQKAGRVLSFEMQPEFILQERFIIVEGKSISDSNPDFDKLKRKYKAPINRAIKYIADFLVVYADKSTKVIDVKGIKTADFKIKEKMFNFKYPDMNFECVIWDGPSKAWLEYSEYEKAKKARKKKKSK